MALVFVPIDKNVENIWFNDGSKMFEIENEDTTAKYFQDIQFDIVYNHHLKRSIIAVEFDEDTEAYQYDIMYRDGDNFAAIELFLRNVEKYVLKPLASKLKNEVLMGDIDVAYGNRYVFFVAPNAYAMDINWPFGELYASVDRKEFNEMHFMSKSYRLLFEKIQSHYHQTIVKIRKNIEKFKVDDNGIRKT